MVEFPPYSFDSRAERLWRGHQPVPLRPKAWALLRHLVERRGLLVTKDELHAAVWPDSVVSDDTLTRTMAELRHALGDDARTPRFIETVHRRGFRFIAQARESGAAAPAAPLVAPAPSAGGSALVGRDAELARLWAHFRQASAGSRQVVFVLGEAGIGKSALVQHFLRAVEATHEPPAVGYGQCVEQFGQREPYMPVLEILERLTGGPHRDVVRSALRSHAPSWLAQLPAVQTPTDAERLRRWHADTTPHRMLREFSGLVEAIASDRPLILALEDLHWSDRATVDLVSVLAQRSERAPLMLLGTYRPAQVAALDHPIQAVVTLLRTQRRCGEVPLEYLTRRDVSAYLEQRFHGTRVAEGIAAAVHARTDGNALFMTVLVDHLVARGWLAEDEAGWRLTVPRAAVEQDVPDNLRQLIEGQLRFASPEERDVLEVASVAGVTFDAPAVAVGFGGDLDSVEAVCHRLCRSRRWLREAGSLRWPDGARASRYAFQHALYQRTLYDRLAPGRRAALHEQIGRRLEAGYAERAGEAAGELARHFQGGSDNSRALRYLEQAAAQAYERRAFTDVIGCLDPALELLEALPDTPERARDELRLRQLYTTVLSQTGGYTSSALPRNLERTRVLCAQLGDVAASFDALSALYLLHTNGGELGLASQIGGELTLAAGRLGASAALQHDFLRGATDVWFGDLGEAELLLSRALRSPVSIEDAERPYGVNPVVASRSFEGLRRWATGDRPGAHAVQKDGIALAERHGRPYTVVQAAMFSAFLCALDGDMAEAGARAREVLALSDEYGFPRWRGRALVVQGLVLVEQGDGARGLAQIRDGLDELGRTGLRLGYSLLRSLQASACLRAEQMDEGLAAVDAGLGHCRETTERLFEPELWRLRGEIMARRTPRRARHPEPGEAAACFAKARALARAHGSLMFERRARDLGAAAQRSR